MKMYFSLFRMKLIAGMQYRAAAWAGIATQFFWGFMVIMIYEAFYRSSSAGNLPMDFDQVCRYVWLQQAFLHLFNLWNRDNELLEMITSGTVSYELCRPLELFPFWYARLLGQRLAGTVLRCVPVLMIASLLPGAYRMTLPPSVPHALLFLAALTVAMLLATAINMFVYILTFKLMNAGGATLIVSAFSEFLSGSLIAIPFMPKALQYILYVLPFRYTADFPFRFYTGNIPMTEGLWSLAAAVGWLAVLYLLGAVLMKRALRTAVLQGG